MNKKQENRNSSYKKLKELFIRFEEAIKLLPNLSAYVLAFIANCLEIDKQAALQGIDKSGLTDNKEIQHAALIAAVLDVSKRLMAYATVKEDPILLKEAKVTSSDLHRLTETQLYPKALSIFDLAMALAEEVLSFGITPDLLHNLRELMKSYETAQPQPKLGISESKQVTATLGRLFEQNDALLKKCDALIELLEGSHPDFYHSYKNVRRVIAAGQGSLAMQGLINDAVSKLGIKNAHVLIEETTEEGKAPKAGADLQKVVKFTALKGGFKVKSLPEGRYTLTISKLGYVTQVVFVNVIAGELCRVSVELVSE